MPRPVFVVDDDILPPPPPLPLRELQINPPREIILRSVVHI